MKAFVPVAGKEDDLLHGLPVETTAEFHFAQARPQSDVELEFQQRTAVVNYRDWIKDQGIEHVGAQFRPDLPLVSGEPNDVTLSIINHGPGAIQGELRFETPSGWAVESAQKSIKVPAGMTVPVHLRIKPPSGVDADLRALFTVNGNRVEAIARLHPLPRTGVIRLKRAPALDGSDHGWENVPILRIAPTNLFQGKVADDADSSATFRLAHHGAMLYVDVQVRDDVVVTNIAPNDIKGHWRSDSIEICLDPLGGAEHTMDCYKLGIFPFDTTGVVRAARDADANQGPVEETAPKTRLVSRRTADGYRVQAAIPFREIGVPREGKKRLGFNLIIYDGDKRDAALGENINKSRIAWAPRSGVMGRPEDWGRIDLE